MLSAFNSLNVLFYNKNGNNVFFYYCYRFSPNYSIPDYSESLLSDKE